MIRELNNNILRKVAEPVKEIINDIKNLLHDMVETMEINHGVGLAAPQIGISLRIVVIKVEDVIYKLINPIIVKETGIQNSDEGCLSLPNTFGKVWRPAKVIVKALDENGKEIKITGYKLLACALCHEIDHLDGVLFTDKLS